MFTKNESRYKLLVYLISFTTILFSCSEDASLDIKTEDEQQISLEKFIQNKGIDEGILSYSEDDLQGVYYSNTSMASNQAISDNVLMDISLTQMDEILEDILAKYPDTDELSDEDILMIQNDFGNGYLDLESIVENIDLIDSTYLKLIRFDLVNALADFVPESTVAGRDYLDDQDYFGTGLNNVEFWALIAHPRLIGPTRDATDQTLDLVDEFYPNANLWRTKGDAFRHALWNALIAKNVGDKFNKIGECTGWANTFTSKHEAGSTKPESLTDAEFELDQAMDYHNNDVGRSYFSSVAVIDNRKWWQSAVVRSPSKEYIAESIYDFHYRKAQSLWWIAHYGYHWDDRMVYLVD